MEEGLRLYEEGATDNSKAGCVTSHHPRVLDTQANDPGIEQSVIGSIDTGQRSCGGGAENVHTRLEPLIRWILSGNVFSHVRDQDKIMDNRGQEDEGLDASKVRRTKSKESAERAGFENNDHVYDDR